MCGISGIFAFNQVGAFYMINLAKSLDLLSQRGPDARGTYLEDLYGVGHRRLSIIDVDHRSNQPMKDDTGRYVIAFNGEIFNYKTIRESLEKEGITFQTNSDTEVLLKNYIFKKEKAFEDFVGFFAFAIYDTQEQELVLCRDRYGIKPLVYYYDEDKLVFASELKSVLAYNIPKEMDSASVHQYFQFNYVPPQHTIFENVHKLSPGTYLKIKKKEVLQHRYYTVQSPSHRDSMSLSYEQSVDRFRTLMEQSVVDRLVADVPLGTFLSGGLDSSIITGIAARHYDNLHSFSIGYQGLPVFDESEYALAAAKQFGTKHHVFQLTEKDFADTVFQALDYIDEPFADSAMLPLYILSQKASKHLKVALSGDGADEILGGYNKHEAELRVRSGNYPKTLLSLFSLFTPFMKESRNSKWGLWVRKLNRFNAIKNKTLTDRYYALCLISQPETVDTLFQEDFGTSSLQWKQRKQEITRHIDKQGDMNNVFRSDIDTVLVGDMLYKTDMMSMANGLEVRVPFLDHRLVDFVMSLPGEYKIDSLRRKKIARDAFANMLPKEVLHRKKKGFDVPVQDFLYRNEGIKAFLNELTQGDFIKEQGIFNESFARAMLPSKTNTGKADPQLWWAYVVFQYWYKKHMGQ